MQIYLCLVLVFLAILLFLQDLLNPVSTIPLLDEYGITYLDERLCGFKEMVSALRLGPFLVPINDSLIGNTIFVVQDLRHLPSDSKEEPFRKQGHTFKIWGNALMMRVSS